MKSFTDFRQNFSFLGQLILICLWPILMPLSHRNVAGDLMLLGVAGIILSGALPAIREFARNAVSRAGSAGNVLLILFLWSTYASLSFLWSPVEGRLDWIPDLFLFVTMAAFAIWSIGEQSRLRIEILFALAAAMLILSSLLVGMEALTSGILRSITPREDIPLAKNLISVARGTSATIIMLMPFALAMVLPKALRFLPEQKYRIGLVAVALLALGMAAFKLEVFANALAFVAGAGGAIIAWLWPRIALKLAFGGMGAAFLFAPLLALFLPDIEQLGQNADLPVSWVQRLIIWRYATDHIFASIPAFLFGNGTQFSWYLSGLEEVTQIRGFANPLPIMPTHPHNIFLQIWLELGAMGALLSVAVLYACAGFLRSSGLTKPEIVSVVTLVAIMMVYASVEMSLWTLWRWSALGLAIYLIALANRRKQLSGSV